MGQKKSQHGYNLGNIHGPDRLLCRLRSITQNEPGEQHHIGKTEMPQDVKRCKTPLSKEDRKRVEMDVRPVEVIQENNNPKRKKDTKWEEKFNVGENIEPILFASQGCCGIVDLGASQSVMGHHQVGEFLAELPKTVQARVREQEVSMTFRFGNNSTVSSTRALLIPIGQVWLRIAIVNSNTPFLISNTVFRSLGATIDTQEQIVHFKKLKCSVPLKLSDRRLFMLSIAELIQSTENASRTKVEPAEPEAEKPIVLHVEEQTNTETCTDKRGINKTECDETTSQHKTPAETNTTPEPTLMNHHHPKKIGDHCVADHPSTETVITETSTGNRSQVSQCQPNQQLKSENVPQSIRDSCEPDRHGQQHASSIQGRSEEHGGDRPGGRLVGTRHHHTATSNYEIRNGQTRTGIPRSGEGRKVLRMVPGSLSRFPKASTQGVPSLPQPVHRDDRDSSGRPKESTGEDTLRSEESHRQRIPKVQGQRFQGQWHTLPIGDRERRVPRHGGLVTGDGGTDESSRRSTRSHVSNGVSNEPDHDAADSDSNRFSQPCDTQCLTCSQSRMITQACEEFNAYVENSNVAHSLEINFAMDQKENWVLNELKEYMKKHPPHKTPRGRLDLLEIYCSDDSQLNQQGKKQGMTVHRFSLSQGDLRTQEGRMRLYDLLIRFQPRDVWMSPVCKAWCKWNQFNASKSPEAAQRVMEARQQDEVHLKLCSAVFWYQQKQDNHFHLEQPVGSHMIFQESLAPIVNGTHRAVCHQCTAGELKHPETSEYLRKGMQILTTSTMLKTMIQQYTCSRDHRHAHVAGSYRDKQGRCRPLSSFTELYTPLFARRVCRALMASRKIDEKPIAIPTFVARAHEETENIEEGNETENKRRRLAVKQAPPEAYEPSSASSESPDSRMNPQSEPVLPEPETPVGNSVWQQILDATSTITPKVGARIVGPGKIWDMCQQLITTHQIKSIEVCKGADRLRKPPERYSKGEAPERLTIGIHRQSKEIFHHDWENWETYSGRKLVTKTQPSRILVTIFGKPKSMDHAIVIPPPKRPHQEDSVDTEPQKKHKGEMEEQSQGQPITQVPTESSVHQAPESVPKFQGHGPKFRALKPEERQWLTKVHSNLGHPNVTKMKNILQMQHVSPQVLEALADFHCDTCHELQRPKLARPAAVDIVREFNDCIGCDIVTWTNAAGQQHTFLHIIDLATNFQVAAPVFQTDHQGLIDILQRTWISWAGPPKELVIDGETGLCSEGFKEFCRTNSISTRVVAAYAHWQMGKVERHGEILQSMLRSLDKDQPLTTTRDFEEGLYQCCGAKNSLSRIQGYTPEILVLGKSRRLPGSITNEPFDAANQALENEPEETSEGSLFRKKITQRENARIAFIKTDNDQALRRAFLRRARPHRGNFLTGTHLMFWRKNQWQGPGRVIVQEEPGIIWISHFGHVYRVAPEHVRLLSEREVQKNWDKIQDAQKMDPLTSEGHGVTRYEDLSQQRPREVINESVPPQGSNNVHGQASAEAAQPTSGTSSNHSLDQPDDEPDHPPSIIESAEGNGSLSGEGNGGEEPSVDLPVQIPVPEDTELNCEQDYWIVQGKNLIRVHQRPRTKAFRPTDIPDSPVSPILLANSRTTTAKYTDGKSWQIQDDWPCSNTDWHGEQSWTGLSIFTVIDENPQETQFEDAFHISTEQAWEYNIFLTEHDINLMNKTECDQVAFLASSAKRQRAEVKLVDLNEQDRQRFYQAKTKEIDQWLDTETVRRILRSKIPEENILKCRWILTWKELDPTDRKALGETHKAKARLVILGYQDPNIEEIPRDSPTLQKESRSLLLQMCASQKWQIESFDIKTAFLRGSKRDNRILGMEPPKEMKERMQLRDYEVCELRKSAYGLVNAPYLWYQELKEALINLNFIMSPMDPCLFVLPNTKGGIHGLVGIHVDDGLGCGDRVYVEAIKQLQQKYPFGSHRRRNFVFTGIQIDQHEDGTITLSQKEYVEKITPISINRDRRKKGSLPITEEEKQGLRGLIGSLQYAATNTRADISARLSLLQAKINCATIGDLHEANKLLGDCQKHSNVRIFVWPIPTEQIRFVAYSDASFATREKQQSQKGTIILTAHQDIMEQKPAQAGALVWSSRKIDRIVASTLAAETYALSQSVDLLEWVRILWQWMQQPSQEWKQPESYLLKAPRAITVVDCKSLYDVIIKNTTPQCREHRTLLEALIIKDRIQLGVDMHWVHSAAQLADSLTKAMDTSTLRAFLEHGKTCLHDIEAVLQDRADKKTHKKWLKEQIESQTS